MPFHWRASHHHAASPAPSITDVHQETYRMALVTNKFRHDLAKVNLPIIASYADNYQARQAGQKPQTGYGDYDAFTILTDSNNSVDGHIYSSPRRSSSNAQRRTNGPTQETLISSSNLSSSAISKNAAVNSSPPTLHSSAAPHASSQRVSVSRPMISGATTQRPHTSSASKSTSIGQRPLRAAQRALLPTRPSRLLDSASRQSPSRVTGRVTSTATTHHKTSHITETNASTTSAPVPGTNADPSQRLSEEWNDHRVAFPHCCPASCPPDALGKILNSFSGFTDPEDGDNITGKQILAENPSSPRDGGGVEDTMGKGINKSMGTGVRGAVGSGQNPLSSYPDATHTLVSGSYTQIQLLLAAFAAQCSVPRPPLRLALPSDTTLCGNETSSSDSMPGNEGTLSSVATGSRAWSADVAADLDWATHGRCVGCDVCAATATVQDAVCDGGSGRNGLKTAGGVQGNRKRGGDVGSGSGTRTASGCGGGAAAGGEVGPARRALVVSVASLLHNPWLARTSNGCSVGAGGYGSMGIGTTFVEANDVDRGVIGMSAGENAGMGVRMLHSKNDDSREQPHYGNVNRTTNVTITRTRTFTESRNCQRKRIYSGCLSEDTLNSASPFSDTKSKTLPQARLPRVASVTAECAGTQRLPTLRHPATQRASPRRPSTERLSSQRPIVPQLGTTPRPPAAPQPITHGYGNAVATSCDVSVHGISTPMKPASATVPSVSTCSVVPAATMSLLVNAQAHPFPIQLPSSPSPSPSASPSPSPAVRTHATPTGHVFTPAGMGFTPSGMGVSSPLWPGATAVSPHAVSDTSSSELHRALDASVFFASKSPIAFIKKKFDFGFSKGPESGNPKHVVSEKELFVGEEKAPHIHVVGATPVAEVPIGTGTGLGTGMHLSISAFAPTRRAASAASVAGRSAFVPAASHAAATSAVATAAPSVHSATSAAPPYGASLVTSASERPPLSTSPLVHAPATSTTTTPTNTSMSISNSSALFSDPITSACTPDTAAASGCDATGAGVCSIPENVKVTLSRDSSVTRFAYSPDCPSSPPPSSPLSPMVAVTPLACLSRSPSTDTQQLPSLPAPSLSPASLPASPTLSTAKDPENIFPEEQFLDSENTFSEPGASSLGFSGVLSLAVPSHRALPLIHPSPSTHVPHTDNHTTINTNTTNTRMVSLPFSSPRAAAAPATPSSAPSASSVSAILRGILFALPLAPPPYAVLPESARRDDTHDGPTSTAASSSSTSPPSPHGSSTSPSRPPTRSADLSPPTHGLTSTSFRRTRLLAHDAPTHPLIAATNTLLTHLVPRPRVPPRIRARALPAQASLPASHPHSHAPAPAPSADAVRHYVSSLRTADTLGGVDLRALMVLAAQLRRDARANSSHRTQCAPRQHQHHQQRKHQPSHMQHLRSPRAAPPLHPLTAACSAVSIMDSADTPAAAPVAGTRIALNTSVVATAPIATDTTRGGHAAGSVSVVDVDNKGESDHATGAAADATDANSATATTAACPACPRGSEVLDGTHAGRLAVVTGPSSPRSSACRRASEVAFIRPHSPSMVPARAASSLSHHYPSSALFPSSHLPQSLLAPPAPLATTPSSVSVPVLLSGDQHYSVSTREAHYGAVSSIQRPRSSATNASRRPRSPAIATSSSFFSPASSQLHTVSASTPSAPFAATALAWPLLRCAERELLRDPVLMQMDQHMDALYKAQATLRARTASLLARHEAEDAAIARLQGYYPFVFPDQSADRV